MGGGRVWDRVPEAQVADLVEAGQQALQAQQLVQLQLVAHQQHLRMGRDLISP